LEPRVVSWLRGSLQQVITPAQRLHPGMIALTKLQYRRGWNNADVDGMLHFVHDYVVPEEESKPQWLPVSGAAYERQAAAGLIDDRLRAFKPVSIIVDGFTYTTYVHEGLDVVRILLERHQHEHLVFQYEEAFNEKGERLYGELQTADGWKRTCAQLMLRWLTIARTQSCSRSWVQTSTSCP
jgi:hypothetical protein